MDKYRGMIEWKAMLIAGAFDREQRESQPEIINCSVIVEASNEW